MDSVLELLVKLADGGGGAALGGTVFDETFFGGG